jgi:hypothetical protein
MNENFNLNHLETLYINNDKKQIILTNTLRDISYYILELTNRKTGYFKRIPNFIIGRDGKIYEIIKPNYYTKYFNNDWLNKNSIVVSFENVGWLKNNPLNNEYINWVGDIYNGLVFKKRWRNYIYWEPYKDIQLQVAAELCSTLVEEFSIDKRCVHHNTKINDYMKYNGILTRSNISQYYTDVNPSFNFETFIKLLKYD